MKLTETEVRAPETKPSKEGKEMLPFMTQYQPLVSTVKEALMEKWNLTQNQPLLCYFFKEPPLISYKKGKPPNQWQRTCLLELTYGFTPV